MNPSEDAADQLQVLLENVLRWGTLIATGFVGAGLMFAVAGQKIRAWNLPDIGRRGVEAGIVIFILLPILRVVLMLLSFTRQRDYPFSIIAAVVLGIILLGFALNIALVSNG